MEMKNILSLTLVLGFMSLFIACEKDCPEQDVDSLNAIYLQFKTDGDNAFTSGQLSTMFMVRFQTDTLDTLSFQADTFFYGQDGYYADDYKIRLSKFLPQWEEAGAPYYSAYNYSFQNASGDFNIIMRDIELEGSYDDEDCIYTNTKKQFILNEQTIDVSGSTEYVFIEN